MKKLFYLCLLALGGIGMANAQEIVPITENPAIQRYIFEQQNQLPKALQKRPSAIEKNGCEVENPNETYVISGTSLPIKIEIDTAGLGSLAGTYECLNCENALYGNASVSNDTLYYAARADVTGGKENISVQFCNPSGCRTKTYRIVVRRAAQNHYFIEVPLSPEGVSTLPTSVNSRLPGKQAICSSFLDCGDAYEDEAKSIDLNSESTSITYQASRYAGVDSVCVVLCDSFAICDTFRFSFRIVGDTLDIPFMDDFSYFGPYPLVGNWLDRDAFVNNDMAKDPPSWGVATFDGLDSEGTAYGGGYGEADRMTSNYLNLNGIGGDIFVTYWLQRRGFGDRPEQQDSMVLEFKDRNGEWVYVRGISGLSTNQTDTIQPFEFYRDLIPNQFRYKGFQFRFKNFSDRTGLLDVWHLDYIRVDNNNTDSVFSDIAFTRFPNFITEKYSSMPWRHFKEQPLEELKDSISVGLWNHDDEKQPASNSKVRLFETVSNTNIFNVTLFNGEEANIENGKPVNRNYLFVNDPKGFPETAWDSLSLIMIGPAFDNYDSLSFRLEYTFENTQQNIASPSYKASVEQNDGVRRFTIFDNYFAYDDGTAEAGLIGQAGVQIAVEFTANVEDSLRAVQIHFPRTTIDVSDQEFNLQVWVGNLDNTPDYEKVLLRPLYTDLVYDTLQGFTTYILVDEEDKPKALYLPKGTFYVGWQQVSPCSGTKCIPFGYDRNTPQGLKYLYVNNIGNWQPFPANFSPGAVMLHPVVGNETPPPTTSVGEVITGISNFKLFPNPTRNTLNIIPLEGNYEDFSFSIFNISGQMLSQGILQSQLDVNNYPAGMYFLKIADRRKNYIWNEKFIIAK